MIDSREQQLEDENKRLQQEVKLLKQKIDLLQHRMFGKSSEKAELNQEDFLLNNTDALGKPEGDDSQTIKEPVAKAKKTRKAKRPRLPEHLPVESREELRPQAVIDNPEQWKQIGEEVSEQLDYQPGHFYIRQLVRPKYVHNERREEPPIIAPLPNRWTERCIATPGLQAHIAISKYVDHLPLYRQEQIFKTRYDVHIPRNTMSRWMEYVAESVKLIYLCMVEQVLAGNYLQVDETPIKYLKPGSGKAQQGYFWAYSQPKGDVLFDWQPSRGHECLLEMLKMPNQRENSTEPILYYQGHIQCDGYSAYKILAKKISGIALAGCWAHVRRKFTDAAKHSPALANWIIKQIQHLYEIEKKLREQKASPSLRENVRESESRPIVARIKKALMIYKARPSILPKSTLGIAVEYALGEWEELEVYLTHGLVEIDNNLVENAIRPTAIGKKNWLFIGRSDTGERSAIIYSILESCRRRGIDPHAYLTEVLKRIPDAKTSDIKDLTPEAWARSQSLPSLEAAA